MSQTIEIGPSWVDRPPTEHAAPVTARDELLERYRGYRATMAAQHSLAMRRIPSKASLEIAKRLGLGNGRTVFHATESEVALLMDLTLYGARPGRTRAIERHVRSAAPAPDSLEGLVLAAMCRARFGVVRVQRRHDLAGVVVLDVMRDVEFWLVDMGLEETAVPGVILAGRFTEIDGFAMSCGAMVPADPEMLLGALACVALSGDPDAVLADIRFATRLYRETIESGLIDQIEFR